MEKWEYLTEFVWANTSNPGWEEYRKQNWPKFAPKQFAPETMIPELNKWGNEGWELVSMEPLPSGIGQSFDLSGTASGYSNIYFCVFKRRKQA
jgi:hypothetical protein